MSRICSIIFIVCLSASAFAAPSAAAGRGARLDAPRPRYAGCEKAQEHFVTVEKLRVHYLESGAGPTLVLIHGNAGAVEDFALHAIGLLCSEYRVVAVDRPGHGKSDRPSAKTPTLEDQAELLHQTLVGLGIRNPILVGHSWGGSLALAYSLQYQSEVSALVLLAPAAYPDSREYRWLQVATKPPILGDLSLLLAKLTIGRRLLKQNLTEAFAPEKLTDDYLRFATKSWLDRKHLKSYLEDEWNLNASLKRLSKHYSEIHIPVVIVTGAHDKVVPPGQNAYRLNAVIPRSQLIELKDTGHEIPQTHPESINRALTMIPASATLKAGEGVRTEAGKP